MTGLSTKKIVVGLCALVVGIVGLNAMEVRVTPPNKAVKILPKEGAIVFSIPFSVETVMPVTTENIEEKAFCVNSFKFDDLEIQQLKTALSQSTVAVFEDGVVRLKIVGLEKYAIYVDRDGYCLMDGKGYRLPTENFNWLRDMMDSLCAR